MALEFVNFSFHLQLLTDTHVGDGEIKPLSALRHNYRNEADRETEVATIVRDASGRPCLPATSLKGALRKALLEYQTKLDIDLLFGTAKNDGTGSSGKFSFYIGKWDESFTDDALSLPYWNATQQTWIATHVAISRKFGSAEHMKLFSEELLPAGGVFTIEGTWFGTLEEAKRELARILSPFASEQGLNIGSRSRLGQGALKFKKPENQINLISTRFIPETGEVETKVDPIALTVSHKNKRQQNTTTLKLTCEGPFMSVDSSQRKGSNRSNRINALKRDIDTPHINLSSIAGALRARAAWISALNGWGGDERFRKPNSWESIDELTPVERLFGVGGWRGLLRLSQPCFLSATSTRDLTSNAIDRFSGAVLESSLFSYEVFLNVEFRLILSLEERYSKDSSKAPLPIDVQLYDELISDISGDIVMLGHATNKGFGWFSVNTLQTGGEN